MKLSACVLMVSLLAASAGTAGVVGSVSPPFDIVDNCNPKIQRC